MFFQVFFARFYRIFIQNFNMGTRYLFPVYKKSAYIRKKPPFCQPTQGYNIFTAKSSLLLFAFFDILFI